MASCRNAALYSLPWLNIPRKGVTQCCGALEGLLAIVLQRMQPFRVKLKQRWILGKLVFGCELHRLELFPVCVTTTLSAPYLKEVASGALKINT